METAKPCPHCGSPKLANAPEGLCPRCLLGHGLRPGQTDENDRENRLAREPVFHEAAPGWNQRIPRLSGILSTLDDSIGPVPRVLLREAPVGEERPARFVSEEMPIAVGDAGRYQLHGEIARGGMGLVLKGRDIDLGRDVAVKVLLESHLDHPEMVRRFVEEAQIGGQLQHPGIVPIYELGRLPDGRLYIAMKLVRGRTLAEILESQLDQSAGRMRHLATLEQVCQAVSYAHACGVVHRDLKPSNIMVGNFGEVQVMDWGLAKVLDWGGIADEKRSLRSQMHGEPVRTMRAGSGVDESRAGSVLGTPGYMAPEQAQGQLDTLDERADVFGLGAILCEILTGQPPYSAPSGQEVYRKASRADLNEAFLRLDSCGADAELIALVKSCLAVVPKDRPRNAGIVASSLSGYLANVQERLRLTELARVRAESRATEERKRRHLVAGLAASLFALVAIGFGGGLWWTWQRSIRVDAANREASATLLEASQLLSRARSASGEDLTPWLELTQWSKRAEALLDRPELGSESRREIQELVETVVRERDRAEAISRDRRTIQQFSTIHADMALDLNYIRADREFAKVFHDYGIDVDLLPPEEAGARIALAPIAVELVNALDQWTFIRRVLSRGSTPGTRYLSAVAQSADPDPWRCRLRDALEMESTNREGARVIYEELATTASQNTLHRESLSRLAYALGQFGKKEKETATTLLRQAQRSHPDDFWINYDLARSLMGTGRAEDAARYFTAAVAIRPRSALALRSLREALREAGHAE